MGHPNFPPHLMDKQPLDNVLRTLEFAPNALGCARKWDDLEFFACEAIGCWFLIRGGFRTQRALWPPHEVRVPSQVAPIEEERQLCRRSCADGRCFGLAVLRNVKADRLGERRCAALRR